jgi:hypothetical protein
MLFIDLNNKMIKGFAKVSDIKRFGLINASRMEKKED